MEKKIILDPEVILNKEFKVDFKGYSLAEVDHFLDLVMQDYISFGEMIDAFEAEITQLKAKVDTLEQHKQMLEGEVEALEAKDALVPEQVTNVDLLRRISLLERAVFNNK